MINSLEINDFRALNGIKIILGKHITVLSGRNGIGKSTILALLGNACEIKGNKGKTLFNTPFRTEFSEIFKGSELFDKSGANKCRVNFCEINNFDKIIETKVCRISWQTEKKRIGKRFRVIPETKGINHNSRKKEWPSLYLGLSRLYPIGEVKDERIKINKLDKISPEEKKYFIENYNNILNLTITEAEVCLDIIEIGDNPRKKGIGVNTSNYSSVTNSAGQDNIGQIIMAVISFQRLKEKYSEYSGGILLIDEIDATLHPLAQNKLVDYLNKCSKELNLQVVFTTHSISLLKYIAEKIKHNDEAINNNYEVYYFTKNNGPLKVNRNPEYSSIESDLTLSKPEINKRIAVYTEDDEGRWMVEKLIKKYSMYVRPIRVKLSCDSLIQLNKNDPVYFSNIIMILDGDVDDDQIANQKNIIKLPGAERPEKVIYDFLINLDSGSDLWVKGEGCGFAKENIIENGPESNKYDGKAREKYKKWFNEYLLIMDGLGVFEYWAEENKVLYDQFEKKFVEVYNIIAKRIYNITI